eukprot:14587607-Alexandrium_andersonii.AAC.1
MAALWSSADFGPSKVKALRDEAMLAPVPPGQALQQRLEAVELPFASREGKPRPSWLPQVCWNRDALRESALVFQVGDQKRAFAF